jgi:hypothetical protein
MAPLTAMLLTLSEANCSGVSGDVVRFLAANGTSPVGKWTGERVAPSGFFSYLVYIFLVPCLSERFSPENMGLRRSHLASVNMAWAALETALATALSGKGCEPIEQLRRTDFLPVGSAILEFKTLAKSSSIVKREATETQLRAIRGKSVCVGALAPRMCGLHRRPA